MPGNMCHLSNLIVSLVLLLLQLLFTLPCASAVASTVVVAMGKRLLQVLDERERERERERQCVWNEEGLVGKVRF